MKLLDIIAIILAFILFLFSLWGLLCKVNASELHDFIKEQEVAKEKIETE